jgi:hypothetical protein
VQKRFEAKEHAFAREKKLMQDKSFWQAMQDVQENVSSHVEDAIQRMLLRRVTAAQATGVIQDESLRVVVTNELMTGQIIALLALLRDGGLLEETQYAEFTAYLQRSLLSQHMDVIAGRASH